MPGLLSSLLLRSCKGCEVGAGVGSHNLHVAPYSTVLYTVPYRTTVLHVVPATQSHPKGSPCLQYSNEVFVWLSICAVSPVVALTLLLFYSMHVLLLQPIHVPDSSGA